MRRLGLIAALLLAPLQAGAQVQCRHALSIGLDVSGSVNAEEYRLQLDGLAAALLHPEVQEAMLAFAGAHVRLQVYEWAGRDSQRDLLDWTEIRTAEDLARIAATLRATPRIPREPETAIGLSMLYGALALAQQPTCWRRTLDLSGDGRNNTGPRPRDLRGNAALDEITVNALVVGSDSLSAADRRQAEIAGLWAYFKVEVIRGPEAFVEVALGFEDFEAAMARKLLKELQTLAVSRLAPR